MERDISVFRESEDWTLFHDPKWLTLLIDYFPDWQYHPEILTLPDGRRVWFPLLITDKTIIWHWIETLPFGFPCYPLAEDGILSLADVRWLMAQIDLPAGWFAINIDPLAQNISFEGDHPTCEPITTHILNLDSDFDTVHGNFTSTMRYDMRRAVRDGVQARRSYDKADFDAYFDLMVSSAKRWELDNPPYPAVLYDALCDLAQEEVQLWVAEYESQIIGGLINIQYHPNRMLHWSSAIAHDFLKFSPTKLLQREAIQTAIEHGVTHYNMGPSVGYDGSVLEGVIKTKESLGATAHDYQIIIQKQPMALRVRSLKNRLTSLYKR